MRFERKFLTHYHLYDQTEDLLRHGKIPLHEIYEKRYVNNLYFDTQDFEFYHANLKGEELRVKVRIRWYGDLDKVVKPILEYKIRKGTTISKNSYPVGLKSLEHILDPSFIDDISKSCEDPKVAEHMKYLKPALINRYYRGYYLTENELVRATIDEDVEFYSPEDLGFFFKERSKLIELKYSPDDEDFAIRLSNTMPFRMTRNSKYVNGLSKLLWFNM